MRLKSLSFYKHPLFGDATFNFTDPKGNILDTIVLVGINGTGKTTFLNTVKDLFVNIQAEPSQHNTIKAFTLDLPKIDDSGIDPSSRGILKCHVEDSRRPFHSLVAYREILTTSGKNFPETFPKIVYLPPFYSDEKLKSTFEPFNYSYSLDNVCNSSTVRNIPRFFATYIDKEIMDNDHLVVKDAVSKACKKINTIFDTLSLNIELIGLKKDGSKLPIFKNKQGHNFDINGLSSGEKQLFIRLLSLQMMSVNNSIILVDEPEVSLHPTWQQKIVKVFQSIGENNQIIFATHSPHILASVDIDSLRFFALTNKKIQISTCKDIAVGNHAPIDIILHEFMGTSPRTPEFMTILSNIRNLVTHNKFDTPEFENFMSEAISLAGINDIDLALIRFEINRLKATKND